MLLLMTAGALSAEGRGSLRLPLVVIAGVIGCLAADGFWYWLGRRWGNGVILLVCSFTSNPTANKEKSKQIFQRWGLRLLLIAKTVPGLDGVSPPLAGAEGATTAQFLAYDAAGSVFWTVGYVLLGFLFSRQLDVIMRVISRFGTVLAIIEGLPFFVIMAWRGLHLFRAIRHLRLRRISPALLIKKIEDPEDRVAVFDLLEYEARDGQTEGTPGSLRVNPIRLKNAPRLVIPSGIDVVLYCTSRNELISGRVADSLLKQGFPDVWVMEGGLEACLAEGLPVTSSLGRPQDEANRLGIVLPPELR